MQIVTVASGDSLWSIARRYGVTVEALAEANGIAPPYALAVGQALVVPTPAAETHTVRPGESLWSIANRYGTTVEELARLNGISNPAQLAVGMTLRLPQRGKPSIVSNAYLQPGTPERDAELVRTTAPYLSYLSPFSYRVQGDGSIEPLNDGAILEALGETNAAPMMVITNFAGGTFSAEVTKALFASEAAQNKLIDGVVRIMQEKGYIALNIDFEHIFPDDRENYNAFLRRIAPRIRAEGHLVSTALAPKTSATQVGPWYEAHDYPAHGDIVDFVIIMTYEWGWSGGPPMAVAPIPQVRQVLDYAVSVIPRRKIVMGAPLYGYDWTLPYVKGGPFAKSLGGNESVQLAVSVGASIQFDRTAQAPHFTYWDSEGKQHVVWFEDARSMQAKFDLIKEYGLRGISYWVLGKPFTQQWVLLEANFTIVKYK